jgi:hypothetical protein
MSFSDFPCFTMNFMAVIWPVHRRRPLYTCCVWQAVIRQLVGCVRESAVKMCEGREMLWRAAAGMLDADYGLGRACGSANSNCALMHGAEHALLHKVHFAN